MSETCLVLSGKGGVGKTTILSNVATSIAMMGKKTAIIDADLAMANLALAFGLQDMPITLHEVLAGKAPISGVVLNRIETMDFNEIMTEVKNTLELDILSAIPNDLKIKEAAMRMVPLVTYIPESPASIAMTKLAANIAGVEYNPTIKEVGWFQRLIGKSRVIGIENYGSN